MSETTPETPQTPQAAPEAPVEKPAKDEGATPPWGDDFDPEKAWDKIQKANREAANLRQRVMTPEQQKQLEEYTALVEASKSEAERKDEAAATAQRERDEAKSEATRYKIALRHGIAEDDFDLLGSGTEEQIEARAKKVADKNEAAKQAALEAAVQPPASAPTRRPTEQLRPGASPSPDPVQDDSQYPDSWLSPSQRSRVEQARGGATS